MKLSSPHQPKSSWDKGKSAKLYLMINRLPPNCAFRATSSWQKYNSEISKRKIDLTWLLTTLVSVSYLVLLRTLYRIVLRTKYINSRTNIQHCWLCRSTLCCCALHLSFGWRSTSTELWFETVINSIFTCFASTSGALSNHLESILFNGSISTSYVLNCGLCKPYGSVGGRSYSMSSSGLVARELDLRPVCLSIALKHPQRSTVCSVLYTVPLIWNRSTVTNFLETNYVSHVKSPI